MFDALDLQRPPLSTVMSSTTPQQQQQQQAQQALLQNMPQLINLAKQGLLNDAQLTQLKNLARLYGAQRPPNVAGPSTANQTQPAAQVPQPAAQVSQQPQPAAQAQGQTQIPAAPGQAAQPQAVQAPAQNVAAGQKRKSPMPELNTAAQANATSQVPTNALSATAANFPLLTAAVNPATPQVTPVLTTTNPGPQPWPNTAGPRPTLSQGLATGSAMIGTPAHIVRTGDTLDVLTALDTFKKDASSNSHDHQMRRTIKDLVASIDPNVKIDREVEDMLLDMADEFIDSVTNFACRLAKHRGSESLDVKDLQLHLERNHNIRIPGFSSDETRLAISHANPATGHQAPKAPKVDSKSASAKPESEGTKDKDKTANKDKASKSKAAKAKDTQSNVALRAARLAAVKALK
ncbi:Transcription initiation factor TFIID subunit 12 [Tulasnella sp. 418]|nr:Transcription initiation factor TFIID subunit 12 [Tulasnella sp. 418]